jgi:hypothetical protein
MGWEEGKNRGTTWRREFNGKRSQNGAKRDRCKGSQEGERGEERSIAISQL